MNWKLKISNTADNAGVTQSQTRDTRHRQMQEVNSLCTDSGPLRAEYCIVAYHTMQFFTFQQDSGPGEGGSKALEAIKFLTSNFANVDQF